MRVERIEYFCVKPELKPKFIVLIENKFLNKEVNDMCMFDSIMKEVVEITLKREFLCFQTEATKIKDPVWFTNEIHERIKLRKHYNRSKRNAKNDTEKDRYWALYKEQKRTVQQMVKGAISKYEEKFTTEIRQRGEAKHLWKKIHKLRGIEISKDQGGVYGNDGKVLDSAQEKIICWRSGLVSTIVMKTILIRCGMMIQRSYTMMS